MVSDNHEAVMVKEVINNLILDKQGSYIDGTFGLGGHSKSILENLELTASLTAIDRDPESTPLALSLIHI